MKRILALCTITTGLTACQNNADEIAALTQRVAALEKKVAAAPRPKAARRPQRPDPTQTYFLPVRDDDPFRGAAHAKVTIVEAYEFACPYCALIEPMLADALKAYESTDTLKVVSKQFVVHPRIANDAALATCAAHQQGRFEPYAEALWAKSWTKSNGRPRMKREQLQKAELIVLAREVGLDEARFTAAMESPGCRQKIQRDRQELTRIGVRGTPYLFINGRYYTGARSAEALRAAIDAAAKKADQALSAGARLAEYYDGLMKTAKRRL